jgi:hypothetical protein
MTFLRNARVPTLIAACALVIAGLGIGIGTAAGIANTVALNGGDTLAATCSGRSLTVSKPSSTSANLTCVAKKTSPTTTTTLQTTTTTQPTTTTTTVPPTTTTTTQPSSCPGGETTGENYANGGGTLGPYKDPDIYGSNGYITYVEVNGSWQDPSNTNTLCVQNASNWSITADYGPAGNGAVQGYPDTQEQFNPPDPTSLSSTFNITDPPDSQGNWEAAYDLWGNWGNGDTNSADVMVWEDTSTARGLESSYGGATIQNTNAIIDGQSYTVIYYCGQTQNCTASSDTEHMLVHNTNQTSGTENLQDDVNYLMSIGDLSDNSIGQADFGWELCSTGTASVESPQTFTLNSYTLTGS